MRPRCHDWMGACNCTIGKKSLLTAEHAPTAHPADHEAPDLSDACHCWCVFSFESPATDSNRTETSKWRGLICTKCSIEQHSATKAEPSTTGLCMRMRASSQACQQNPETLGKQSWAGVGCTERLGICILCFGSIPLARQKCLEPFGAARCISRCRGTKTLHGFVRTSHIDIFFACGWSALSARPV